MTEAELKPCRHCGNKTRQRAEGVPYCSMECIGGRRREQEREKIECPYPNCEWEREYLPGNGLSKAAAYKDAEDHRKYHAKVNREVWQAVNWAVNETVYRLADSPSSAEQEDS